MSPSRFWIVKANRRFPIPGLDNRYGNLDYILEARNLNRWLTYKHIDRECSSGDGIFFWRSSPHCDVRGLGTFGEIETYDTMENYFHVHYDLKGPIPNPINIRTIRESFRHHPLLTTNERDASFLKAAIVQTVYPLTKNQARVLAALVIDRNSSDDSALAVNTCKRLREWFPAPGSVSKTDGDAHVGA